MENEILDIEQPVSDAQASKKVAKKWKKLTGGDFLVKQTKAKNVFIPEEWDEEQKMIVASVHEFILQEIIPVLDELDTQKDKEQMPAILERAGEMGFTSLSISEEYGGMALDFNTGLLFGEAVAPGFAFATVIGAQTSIGSLPIVYYGTKEQKERYLPKIATAEWKAAYCLTEPDAGSDANSGKTKAILNEAGTHYMLNGQKMWITNGGFADIFIVFAKIDDDKNLSAFIVEKAYGGVSIGPEEKKMGIKGSSTVQVFFNDCPVPAENLLGERGKGFKIALNILNTGRIKLAAGGVGGSKVAIAKSVKYANERKQFGKSIGEFGAIKHKLGDMAVRTFTAESGTYRIGYNIDRKTDAFLSKRKDGNKSAAYLEAIKEFAIECAIMKVYGSEVLGFATDEAIQIHGGMGYAQETGVERGYRDGRITRIYEGTNEINRMLSVGELFKRAFQEKKIDLVGPLKQLPIYLAKQVLPSFRKAPDFATETQVVENLKYVFLLISGRAGQKLKLKLVDEQEIIMNLADILAAAYVAESTLLRVQKMSSNPEQYPYYEEKKMMLQVYLHDALKLVRAAGQEAIMAFSSGAEQKTLLLLLSRLTPHYSINPKKLRRKIADKMLEKNTYCYSPYSLPDSSTM